MRITTVIIATFMAMNLFAQQSETIVVERDTVIYVRDALSLTEGTYLYGEKFDGSQKGGTNNEYFKVHQVSTNANVKGVTVGRDTKNCIFLNIIASELQDGQAIQLKCATYTNKNGWCPDDNNIKTIIVKGPNCLPDGPGSASASANPTDSTSVADETDKAVSENTNGLFDNLYLNIWLVEFVFLIILVFVLWLWITNRQIKKWVTNQIKQSKEENQYQLTKKINEIKNAIAAEISSQVDMHRHDISLDYIKGYIDESFSKLSRMSVQENGYTSKIISDSNSLHQVANTQPITESISSIDTDNVIYNIENNSFRIGETDIKIFRIYSKGNEYYYTILENTSIREEFASMIASYSSCVTIINPGNSSAKAIEPVKSGRLVKNGDTYFVDSNNKLELQLV